MEDLEEGVRLVASCLEVAEEVEVHFQEAGEEVVDRLQEVVGAVVWHLPVEEGAEVLRHHQVVGAAVVLVHWEA